MKHLTPKSSSSISLLGLLLAFSLAAPAWAGGDPEEKVIRPAPQHAATVERLKATMATLNQQLATASPKLRLFAQLADKAKSAKAGHLMASRQVVKVANAQSWPELTVTSFVVLLNDSGQVAALQAVPVSESGDWNNGYTHYFDAAGNTIAFERSSSFFYGCMNAPTRPDADTVTTETSRYYYQDRKLIAKDYRLVGTVAKKEVALSPAQCEFAYRHPYTIHPDWAAARAAAGITQDW